MPKYSSDMRGKGTFQTTRWSLVRQALSEDHPESVEGLARLCECYWYPVYAYIRRSGHSPHDAEDLTQEFFAKLIEKRFLAVANEEKGKFRTFLLVCVRRFLGDASDRARAQKRGRGRVVSIDPKFAELRYSAESIDDASPDRLYQRRWALTLLQATGRMLETQYRAKGKGELFESLRPFLGYDEAARPCYEELASTLDLNVNTVKSHVRRFRERWRELLLSQVAATLDDPTSDNIKAELAELLGCL